MRTTHESYLYTLQRLDDANPSSLALRNELSYLEKKMEIELWLENNRSVDSLVSSDNEFEEEIEIEEDKKRTT
nr:hypothetical protein [Tanacetum cinerariifolium]